MPANLLIFDAEYIAELTARMNTACELMSEAVSSLKSASNHENWKCKERTRILEDFDNLNVKLGRLDSGVNQTTRILGNSVSRFEALESRYDSQAGTLSDELTANHGFSATVHTDGGSSGISNPESASAGAAGAAATGTASAGAASAPGTPGSESHSSSQGGGGMSVSVPGGFRPGGQSGGTTTEGGSTMNVNLPVTHIPDAPDAAAKGIKGTQEIADAVTDSVAAIMTEALGGHNWGSHSVGGGAGMGSTTGIQAAAGSLAEAYNAGRSIFENSAAIIASPTQPHTTERLAMAAGIVTLAGTAAGAGITVLGQAAGSISSGKQAGSGGGDFASNAGRISAALQDNSDAAEFREVLGVLSGSGSSSSSGSSGGSKKGSFFDMIVDELKKAFSGTQDGSSSSSLFSASSASSTTSSAGSSLSGSSPIMEFLGNFVMDQAV